jgi:hypothetical protein
MDLIRQCKYCNQEFLNIAGKVFSNHVRWCKLNPSRNNTANICVAVNKHYDLTLGEIKDFEVNCAKCGKQFFVKERTNNFPEKDRYFCSRSCANSKVKSQESKDKTSKTLKGRQISKRETRICIGCNQNFVVTEKSNQKFCSNGCRKSFNKSDDEFLSYRFACSFKFNIWKYPEEFELELIKKHGWYQAANRGNNLDGVSRDHKISVKYGWENDIPSEIIAHPANCQLMQQRKNSSKYKKCSVNLDVLLEDIKTWNGKYT